MEKEKLDLLVYVNRSCYRVKVLKTIGTGIKIPKQISQDSGLIINHVSNILKELLLKDLVYCINPEFRKGRMYKLTDKAWEIMDYVEYTPRYSTLYKKYGEEEESSSVDS